MNKKRGMILVGLVVFLLVLLTGCVCDIFGCEKGYTICNGGSCDLDNACKTGFDGGWVKGCAEVDYIVTSDTECTDSYEIPALNFKEQQGIKTKEVDGTSYYIANYYILGPDAFLFYNDPEQGSSNIKGLEENHMAVCYRDPIDKKIYPLNYGLDLDKDMVGSSDLSFVDLTISKSEVIEHLKSKYGLKKDCQDFIEITQKAIQENINFTSLAEPELNCPQNTIRGKYTDDFCQLPGMSKCSICIHPPMPWDITDLHGGAEVCGDKDVYGYEIDNDCNPDTSDNCDENQFACEQTSPGEGLPQQFNIYNQKFSWIDTPEGGYCCGYHGVEDLGKTISQKVTNKEFICLKDDPELVGTAGGKLEEITEWGGTKESGPEVTTAEKICESGGWCWIPSTGMAKFQIFTIKKPQETIFDVVSNGQKWLSCQESNPGPMDTSELIPGYKGEDSETSEFDLVTLANNYYCYQEGNHWSWAECMDADALISGQGKNGIKERAPGDSLFALDVSPEGQTGTVINYDFDKYQSYYGDDFKMDFPKDNFLEFYLRFNNEIKYPAKVTLNIYGPEQPNAQTIYFGQDVLGYAVPNSRLETGKWIHIKIPITAKMLEVTSLSLMSGNNNNVLELRNIYLSSGEEPKVCSGDYSPYPEESSWLEDFDYFSIQSPITGQKLCNARFDPENNMAWLGGEELSENPERRCCGDDPNEYYSGDSANNYGCWNSQPIGVGNTTMNLNLEITYQEETPVIEYGILDLKFIYTKVDKSETKSVKLGPENPIQSIDTISPEELAKITPPLTVSPTDEYKDKLEIYFYDPVTGMNHGSTIKDLTGIYQLQIVAHLFNYGGLVTMDKSSGQKTAVLNFSCSQPECTYPLPGLPPYYITNPYPDLYELYFIGQDGKPLLVDQIKKEFKIAGNLRAKKVAQQVIFATQPEDPEEKAFFGCNPAKFLVNDLTKLFSNTYCDIRSNFFCSPSQVFESDKEKYTTINTWSKDPISEVGYDELVANEAQTPEEFYKTNPFHLKGQFHGPEQRNYSSTILPARNFVPNAEFAKAGSEITHWEVWEGNNKLDKEKSTIIKKEGVKSVNLETKYVLKSEKIAVPEDAELQLDYTGTAKAKIVLVDKEGKRTEKIVTGNSLKFNTEKNTYLILELEKGTVNQPMLQLIDQFGPTGYLYQPPEEIERAGMACCPEKFCWNGYACVEPMGIYTNLAEHISDGRDYRCIDGKWTFLPVLWDWNNQRWGLCTEKNQCLVMRKEDGGYSDKTAKDFYLGQNNYPTCINNSQYIFDHYCSQGNWTSRTKFVASKLVEFAGDKDYTLYCTNYQNALLDIEDKMNYLGGLPAGEIKEKVMPGAEVQAQQAFNCYQFDAAGKRLVPDQENSCVNNFCILKYKDGSQFKVAFATTLNKNISDPKDPFLYGVFKVPTEKLGSVCKATGSEEFIECDLTGLEATGDLWYSDKIGGIVYGRDGIQLNPGKFSQFINKITDWFKELFGKKSDLSLNAQFINQTKNYRELYLLNQETKKVRALRENLPEQQSIIVEYEGFTTPVCSYLKNLDLPPELKEELLEIASLMEKVTCTNETNKQKIQGLIGAQDIPGLDFLWPQMTAKLRVEGMD